MTHRIEIFDTETGDCIGYLRKVGTDICLTTPSRHGEPQRNKSPLLVNSFENAQTTFLLFCEQRTKWGRTLRQMNFRLV